MWVSSLVFIISHSRQETDHGGKNNAHRCWFNLWASSAIPFVFRISISVSHTLSETSSASTHKAFFSFCSSFLLFFGEPLNLKGTLAMILMTKQSICPEASLFNQYQEKINTISESPPTAIDKVEYI